MSAFNYKLQGNTIKLHFNYGRNKVLRISTGYKVNEVSSWKDQKIRALKCEPSANKYNKRLSELKVYFEENNEFYKNYLVQELITGFGEYGEIKSFWIDGEYSYAVNTIDRGEDNYLVKEIIDPRVVREITKIGKRVMEVIPKISFNRKKTIPAMVRIDFTCCLHNKKISPSNYFVNEIESDIAGTYINFPNVKYPMLEVMADTYVKKAKELCLK